MHNISYELGEKNIDDKEYTDSYRLIDDRNSLHICTLLKGSHYYYWTKK